MNKTLKSILADLNLNISSNPKGTDKGDCKTYVDGFYENEFATRRNQKNRLLEIGVRSGASMALWANYFTNIDIVGVDVEDVGSIDGPLAEYLDYPSVSFFNGDAYTREFSETLGGEFSILIDDGPHSLASQKCFLDLYLPKLEKGGVLIIEDIQRDYRDSLALMLSLPKDNRFVFDVFDFRSKSRTVDDFLFVVRHNIDGKNLLGAKMFILYKSLMSFVAGVFRRMKRVASLG